MLLASVPVLAEGKAEELNLDSTEVSVVDQIDDETPLTPTPRSMIKTYNFTNVTTAGTTLATGIELTAGTVTLSGTKTPKDAYVTVIFQKKQADGSYLNNTSLSTTLSSSSNVSLSSGVYRIRLVASNLPVSGTIQFVFN